MELVVGAGFRDALWPDKPHKELLQRALPGRAVALFSADLHTLWLSPAALKLIGREHPTGVLLENDCMSSTAELPTAAVDVQDQWVAEAVRAAAARGVTQIVDYEYADTVTDWLRRLERGTPAARVSCVIARYLLDQAIERGHRTDDVLPDSGGLLTVGPFKLFVDGSLNTRTAYCHDPYPGGDSLGLLELPPAELVPLMRRASDHGLLPAVHAIGDQANKIALDAFEEVGCPGRIEHAQLLSPADVPRFAALGVVAAVQLLPTSRTTATSRTATGPAGRHARSPTAPCWKRAPAWNWAPTRRSRRWTRGTASRRRSPAPTTTARRGTRSSRSRSRTPWRRPRAAAAASRWATSRT